MDDQFTDDQHIHDVIVIGAGVNGLLQLHLLRSAGLDVLTLEAGDSVGGTWYWNRYPGARLDSEAYLYTYAFSRELIEEWDWPEEYADQPTLERYFNFAADRLDLRRSIVFGARVIACRWNENHSVWDLETADGRRFRARFVVPVTGIMAIPYLPPWEGLSDFEGTVVHTANWPREGIDLRGKRVAVVGVGSTGIQVVQSIAPEVGHLTVLQRTPNWAVPLGNYAHTPERVREVKEEYTDHFERSQSTRSCFLWSGLPVNTFDVSAEEREAHYADLYSSPGMTFYQRNYQDLLTDPAANEEATRFLAAKIRERVKDSETARKLTPTHHFATKRPPLETGYYEAFNRDNVELVSLPEEPIVRITPEGIQTSERIIPVDVLIVATGFDAITGSFMKIGIEGVNGQSLAEAWADGPKTFMGVFSHGFPNMLLLGGPQGPNGNQPRCTTFVAEWISQCIEYMKEHSIDRFEVDDDAVQAWVDYCNEMVMNIPLLRDAENWAWGSNVPGKKRAYLMYVGSQPDYRDRLREIADQGYPELEQAGSR